MRGSRCTAAWWAPWSCDGAPRHWLARHMRHARTLLVLFVAGPARAPASTPERALSRDRNQQSGAPCNA